MAENTAKTPTPKVSGKGNYKPPAEPSPEAKRLAEVRAELATIRKQLAALEGKRRALKTEAAVLLKKAK